MKAPLIILTLVAFSMFLPVGAYDRIFPGDTVYLTDLLPGQEFVLAKGQILVLTNINIGEYRAEGYIHYSCTYYNTYKDCAISTMMKIFDAETCKKGVCGITKSSTTLWYRFSTSENFWIEPYTYQFEVIELTAFYVKFKRL